MEESENRSRPRLGRTLAMGALFIVVLYFVLALFVLPWVVQNQLVKLIEAQTGIAPHLESVSFDPIRMRLNLSSFELPAAPALPADLAAEAPEPPSSRGSTLAFDRLILDLDVLGFLSANVALDEVVLVAPYVSLERSAEGALNLVELFSSDASEEEEVSEDGEPFIVEIGSIRVDGGTLRFRDLGFEEAFDVTLRPLSLAVTNFTTRDDETSEYTLDFEIGDQTKVEWRGDLGLEPLQSKGSIAIEQFDLSLPRAYLAELMRARVQQGFASLRGDYAFSLEEALELEVENAALDFADVVIADSESAQGVETPGGEAAREMLALPSLRIAGIQAAVRGGSFRSLDVAEVAGTKGELTVRIDSAGRLQWSEAFAGPSADTNAPAEESPDEIASDEAPEIRVARVALSDFDIRFDDASRTRPVVLSLASTNLELAGFDSGKGSQTGITFDTVIAPKGRLALAGPLTLEPLSGDFDVRAESIPINAFEAYLKEVAAVDVPTGQLAGELKVRLTTNSSGEIQTRVLGDARIESLEIRDPAGKESVLAWEKVSLTGLDSKGSDLVLKEVRIQDATLDFSLGSDGRTNFERLLSPPGANGARDEAAPAKSSMPDQGEARASEKSDSVLRIDRIRIDGLGARFTDASIDPPFRTRVSDLKGSIDGISNRSGSLATIKLDGMIDENAPLRIEGTTNPLRSDGATNLSVVVDGVSMPILSPYSGRYVGYGIERGKLNVRLDYQIVGSKLKARNEFLLDRLRFGEKAEGAKATSLPVPLAMALLKNAKGEVKIDLPIQGDLNDPSFDLIGLLAKTFAGLVTRVATAPFEILGGIVGLAMDDLSKVGFAPGSSELTENEHVELRELAKAMNDRPSLQLDIRGRADPSVDGPALGARAANFAEADWQELARARALAVQAALVDEGKLAAERIFVGGVEIGAFGSGGIVTSELELRAR